MKKNILIFGILCIFAKSLFAQSADFITKTLETESFTYGQAAYLVGTALELVSETDSEAEAVEILWEQGYLDADHEWFENINAADYLTLVSKIWNIKGGLMCRITRQSPRYIFKYMKSAGIVDDKMSPNTVITGRQALFFFTECSQQFGS